jgi:hypothetical protein
MSTKTHKGVSVVNTSRSGLRYRVLVPLARYQSIYGGTFNNAREAAEMSDDIRFWLHKRGVTVRPPCLNFPQRYFGVDPEKLPACPEKVDILASHMTTREQQRASVGTSISDVLDAIIDLRKGLSELSRRLDLLDQADSVKTPNPIVRPFPREVGFLRNPLCDTDVVAPDLPDFSVFVGGADDEN